MKRWGNYKCKGWVWWGKVEGGGRYGIVASHGGLKDINMGLHEYGKYVEAWDNQCHGYMRLGRP